VNDLYDTKLC